MPNFLKAFLRTFLFFYHVYSLFARKRIVTLYFGRDVCTRLGVAIFEVWGTCLARKGRGVSLSALSQDTTSELASLFFTTSPKCRAPSREAVDTIFLKFFGMTRQEN